MSDVMPGNELVLHTTLGPRRRSELGLILPHEHVFVDLRTPDHVGHGEAVEAEVVELMAPQVRAAMDVGVTALVECSTGGVGRRADFDLAVSQATGLPIAVPTGIYREPWVPDWARAATPLELEDWMYSELVDQVDDTGFQAAWIKLSAGDDGLTALEERILKAAAAASTRTSATIGSHSIRGRVARGQLDILERAGVPAERFIWIHTQAEPDHAIHLEVARRGAWLSFDDVGSRHDALVVELVLRILDAGLGSQLLLSHDAGWYDPAQPGGGTPRGYTHLVTTLIPALTAAGVDDATVDRLTRDNPFAAYAR
jgi:phosphotriesterase-related protein